MTPLHSSSWLWEASRSVRVVRALSARAAPKAVSQVIPSVDSVQTSGDVHGGHSTASNMSHCSPSVKQPPRAFQRRSKRDVAFWAERAASN